MENCDTRTVCIFDLDGTIADISHRRHLVENGNHEWDKFYKGCIDDKPNYPVIRLTQLLKHIFYTVIIFSGRSEVVRTQTEYWLHKNQVKYDALLMRKDGDYTPDEVLKQQWLDEMDKENILFVVDDRKKVVDMWRRNGLTCFQVAEGNF